jgi:hypothetical protein
MAVPETPEGIESIDGEAAEERQDAGSEGADDSPPQPFHSARADAPGPKGCWALARHGESCHAPAMRGHSYCAAHSGKGVSGNPSLYSPIGQAAKREQFAIRATIRAMYGSNRATSPRAVLRAHVDRNAERLVGTAVNAALDPKSDPLKAANLAIRLISEADPPAQATMEVRAELTPEDVEKLSWSEALALAQQLGLELPEDDLQLPPGS